MKKLHPSYVFSFAFLCFSLYLCFSCSPVETVDVDGISLEDSFVALELGGQFSLKAVVSPAHASVKTLAWTSSDSSIATVSEEGLVSAQKGGLVSVIATTIDGGYTASCDVFIKDANYNIVEFDFLNMPLPDGSYSVIGNFVECPFGNGQRIIPLRSGAGLLNDTRYGLSNSNPLIFSLVTPLTWDRPWFPYTEGNSPDLVGNRNFSVELPLEGNRYRLLIDGSTVPATLSFDVVAY